jgi:nitroreductase
MDLTEAVRSRRSASRMTGPAPSDAEFGALVGDAATGPDHGQMRPWRLVLVRGGARDALGTAFADDVPADDAEGRARAAAKPLRAPLLVSIVFRPRENPKVPEWEQLAATTCVVYALALLLHDRGWGAIWRTGEPTRSAAVRDLLGVGKDEQLLGWLYVGTAVPATQPARPPFDAAAHLAVLRSDGVVQPVSDPLPA